MFVDFVYQLSNMLGDKFVRFWMLLIALVILLLSGGAPASTGCC